MVKHIWSVLCRESVINKDTNSISLRDCLEKIYIVKNKKGKSTSVNFELVSFWIKEEKVSKAVEFTMETEAYTPEDKKTSSYSKEFVIPKNKKRLRTRIRIQTDFSLTGQHLIKVFSVKKGEKCCEAELPLDVVVKEKE